MHLQRDAPLVQMATLSMYVYVEPRQAIKSRLSVNFTEIPVVLGTASVLADLTMI